MPASKAEQVLEGIKALLETVPGATVERNSVLPEKVPGGGLIILRDGDPGEPEQALGGFGNAYYRHAVEIEVYVEEGDAVARDAAFDALLQQVGTTLEADPTIGGLAFGLTYGRPESATSSTVKPASRRSRTATLRGGSPSHARSMVAVAHTGAPGTGSMHVGYGATHGVSASAKPSFGPDASRRPSRASRPPCRRIRPI